MTAATAADLPAPPTMRQWIGGAVGLAIGLTGIGMGSLLSFLVRLPGYPIACMAIVVFVGIINDRRTRWFAAHQGGMALIVVGWLLAGNVGAAAFNGLWFVSAGIWWIVGGRR